MSTATIPPPDQQDRAFRHEALLYAGDAGFLDGTVPFIRAAVAAGEPCLVVVDAAKIEQLRAALNGAAGVYFTDMAEVGSNPARIIPAWRAFVDEHASPGRRLRGIGEPVWAGRGADELVECQRHESLLNLAFAGAPSWWLLCPYDVEALDGPVIDEAHRSHPFVLEAGAHRPSPSYRGQDPGPFLDPLPEPPAVPDTFVFTAGDLGLLRDFVAALAGRHGLPPERTADLRLVANEMATNSLRHAGGSGTLRLWCDHDRLICEVRDDGYIDEPLVGRVRPDSHQDGGRGLWLANQLCDLVQVRSSARGTTVRLHMALPPTPAS